MSSQWSKIIAHCASNMNLEDFQLQFENEEELILDESGRMTPLMWAAYRNNIPVMNWLISKGANINAKRHDNTTVLIIATAYGHEEAVRILLEKEPNIDIYIKLENKTAIDWGLIKGHQSTVNIIENHFKKQLKERYIEVAMPLVPIMPVLQVNLIYDWLIFKNEEYTLEATKKWKIGKIIKDKHR